jgi:signal transduction histidine kinase/CheY-like chemotaxis protein
MPSSFDSLARRLERAWPAASLRTYMVAVILLATLPMAAFMSYQVLAEVRAQQAQTEDELARSAAALAQTVERELSSSLDALTVLSQSELFQGGRISSLGRLLQGRPRRDWDSIFVLDAGGKPVLDTAPKSSSADLIGPLRALQREVAQGRHAAVLTLSGAAQEAGGGGVAVALPVIQGGELRYVLGARMGEAVWQRLARTASTPKMAHASIFDAQHRLIADSLGVAIPGSALPDEAAQAMLEEAAGVRRTGDMDGRIVYSAWQMVPVAGWHARVAVASAPIDSAHHEAMIGALSTIGLSLLIGVLLASLVARRVTTPLRQLATRGPDQLPGRVAVREIAALRDALVRAREQDSAARESLRVKAQEFEALFNSSPVGMAFAQDPECRMVLHNTAMDELAGPPASHRDGHLRVSHRGRVLAPTEQPLQRAAAFGESISGMELELVRDAQPPVFAIVSAVPLIGADGRPRGAIAAFVDITQRKRIEQRLLATDRQLRESQRLMELAQEAGRVGFFHYDFAADRLAWTPGQCKLFGVTQLPDGALRNWFEHIAEQDRGRVEREFWTACALRREKETIEYCVPQAGGGERWLSSRLMLHYDADGRAAKLTGITVDMSEHRQLERERAQLTEHAIAARRDAEAASRAKDEFLTMLSHELRNPLGAISAAIDVLEAADPASKTGTEARSIIARQTRNLAHMMNDLLDVGRVIAGKVLLARQPVNLAAVVRRVEETLAITGEARDHPLQLHLADAWVDGDAVRIEQVVSNLLTNAIKYTPAGRLIVVRVRSESAMAVLEVQDAGMGIPAALLPHIFDLFVQGQRTLDRRGGGLGIGLTLVRALVELHGGSVGVESSDEGSRFTVRLPEIAAPSLQESDVLLPPSRRRQVLVVEDNDDVLAALRFKLELDGHSVSTAADGIEGLSRLLQQRPEVSIVDIGLPGLTGFELARHARAAGYAGRMIALSGYGAERDAHEALVAGFDAYLVKPVDRNQLRASLSAE